MSKNKTSKIKRKFRLLLDSAFAKPQSFPRLSKKANLAHAVADCGLSPQAEDREIYQKAIETDRFVVTINYQDFKKLVKKGKPGIIAIPSELSNQEIDQLLCHFFSMKNPDDYAGFAIKV
ncbi:MAG: DUF5615 family PIN-like protein [Candidatus Gottesmanbacteria bacterium]|nr:DUF5615 family PIN-like protein [Candidatus Gottesmanbacteria bacterium]